MNSRSAITGMHKKSLEASKALKDDDQCMMNDDGEQSNDGSRDNTSGSGTGVIRSSPVSGNRRQRRQNHRTPNSENDVSGYNEMGFSRSVDSIALLRSKAQNYTAAFLDGFYQHHHHHQTAAAAAAAAVDYGSRHQLDFRGARYSDVMTSFPASVIERINNRNDQQLHKELDLTLSATNVTAAATTGGERG